MSSPNPAVQHYSQPLPRIPTQAEARHLVDMVQFYVGQTQNHFDSRVFFDRMDDFYRNRDDLARTKTPWFLQMLVVFALGHLFPGDFEAGPGTDDVPGSGLFEFALRNLPSLSEQYSHGSLAVETLALVALYLQNVDRQGEAYVYVSADHFRTLSILPSFTNIQIDQHGPSSGYSTRVS